MSEIPTAPVDQGQSLERESELLRRELPPSAARGLAELVILVFLATAAFVLFVPLPAGVRAHFVLRPEGGADPVNAPQAGTIERVFVAPGAAFHQGDPLFVIRSEGLSELASDREELARETTEAKRRLEELQAGGYGAELTARVDRLEGQVRNALSAASAREERVRSLQALLSQQQKLRKQGVSSDRAVLENREFLEDARAEREEARITLSRTEGELQEARAALSDRIRELEAQVAAGSSRIALLDSVLQGAEGDLLTVRAPFDGEVVHLGVERAGVAVDRGKVLAEITRPGARLYAAIEVPEGKAARVKAAEPVRLLFDAYPYTRHGVVRATLRWVSPAARDGKLAAIGDLRDTTIPVDGKLRKLQAGLSGEARIDTGRQTLLDYVLEPLQQIRQNVTASPTSAPRPKRWRQPPAPPGETGITSDSAPGRESGP